MPAVASGYIRLNYTPYLGSLTYVDIYVLAERGMGDPDDFEFFPVLEKTYKDGAVETAFTSFRRKITVDCGVISDRATRLAILYWFLDNNRTVDYGSETSIAVVPQNADGFADEWVQNFSLARRFVLVLDESIVRTSFPV